MGTPHLLHVFPTFCPAGSQVRTTTLMAAVGAEWRHTVVACDGDTSAAALAGPDVELRTVPWSPGAGPMASVRFARRLLRDEDPDLLLTYNWGSMDAILAARTAGVRAHVHHEDGFNADERDKLKGRRNWARRVSLLRTDLIVPSTKLETIARETWRLSRVHMIPNGVDADRLTRDADKAAAFRREFEIPEEAFLIGAVGHLRPIKNFGRLIRAASAAPWPGDIRPHVVIVGDGPEAGALRELAASAGVPVSFTGHLSDLSGAYSAFDVFSLSSDSEQQPVSLLEAMSASAAVAATDVGDIAASLPAEARRFVVPLGPRVEEHLGQAYAHLAGDPALRQRLGAEGRRHVETEFSRDAMVRRYRDVYGAAMLR